MTRPINKKKNPKNAKIFQKCPKMPEIGAKSCDILQKSQNIFNDV